MRRTTPIIAAVAAAFLFLSCLPGPALAALDDSAGPFIHDLGKRAITILVDDSITPNEKAERFRALFREGFAVKALARFTLGRYYKKADAAFFDEYVDVFDEYIGRSYTARFADSKDPIFDIVGVVPDHDPTGKRVGVRVTSHISLPGGKPTPVEWRVREFKGRPIVVDIVAEGISLAVTQQKEFTAVISGKGGDPRALLDILRRKNVELSQN
jgi:phospholipid transport system substrate-binding protein